MAPFFCCAARACHRNAFCGRRLRRRFRSPPQTSVVAQRLLGFRDPSHQLICAKTQAALDVVEGRHKALMEWRPGGARCDRPGRSEAQPWVTRTESMLALQGRANVSVPYTVRAMNGSSQRFQPPAPPGGSTPQDDAYRHGHRPPGRAEGCKRRYWEPRGAQEFTISLSLRAASRR